MKRMLARGEVMYRVIHISDVLIKSVIYRQEIIYRVLVMTRKRAHTRKVHP